MNGYKIVLLKAILCFIGCRKVNGYAPEYVDRAGDIIHEFKFDGNLCKSLPKIDTFIETSVSIKRPIPVSVLREEIVSQYPYRVTRELLIIETHSLQKR